MTFISAERRYSGVAGTGVQYLPGHVEPFVDLVLARYVPAQGEIADLGGGGFRFAVPIALAGRRITVVDADPSGLDIRVIADRVNENGKVYVDDAARARIDIHVGDVLAFLATATTQWALLSAFRLVHFLDPGAMERFFQLAAARLAPGGLLAVSGMTPFDDGDRSRPNEVFAHSAPVTPSNPLFRSFVDTPAAKSVQTAQNLQAQVHLIDDGFIAAAAERWGFRVLVSGFRSTRIVEGFVLQNAGLPASPG
jgi:hypothetical protein